MLPKKNRLAKKEIEELKKRGKMIGGNCFGLVFEKKQEAKFALVVSNNISKKSTKRNKIKRILYQAIKKHLFGEKGHFLFLAKKTSLEVDQEKAEEEIINFKEKLAKI